MPKRGATLSKEICRAYVAYRTSLHSANFGWIGAALFLPSYILEKRKQLSSSVLTLYLFVRNRRQYKGIHRSLFTLYGTNVRASTKLSTVLQSVYTVPFREE